MEKRSRTKTEKEGGSKRKRRRERERERKGNRYGTRGGVGRSEKEGGKKKWRRRAARARDVRRSERRCPAKEERDEKEKAESITI